MDQSHPYTKYPLLEEILQPGRMAFIVNPKAGTNLQHRIERSIDRHLDHKKFIYGIWYTEKSGHAVELAQQAIREAYDIVVAVGGDGSINEVASALIGSNIALGIIPAGSGNGLAMHLGYGRDINRAVQKLNTAKEKIIDCGLLNGRPFFNMAGIGFDGLVSNLMKGESKRGFLPYLFKSVKAGLEYTPRVCTVRYGDQVIEEKCFAIAVANGPMYGYNFQIAPDARLDDGVFSVVILKDAPKWQYFAAVPATLSGQIYDENFVDHFVASQLTISGEGPNYVHIDGEGLVLEGDMHFEVKSHALKILVPQ